ncbi:MAG: insulinase family protein [Verrucomicrobiaceae bacterium]|nr:MAG: insulinase family protein [Verrucomicrobiaceae bacterium]
MNFMLATLAATSLLASSEKSPPSLPDSSAQVFTFENGLSLIVQEDRSAPVASVQAWCGTGSIHEGAQMGAGLSHILEHMLFKGTETRPPGAIAKEVQNLGGYINAYTSFDRTVYWIDVPSDGASKAVAILADAMMNATLPEEEYKKEQEVIRREFAMGFDDPNRQASQLMLKTVFTESPLRHPVIGYLDVYNKLTREDVLRYYKSRYVPNNLTFVVTGDVDAMKIRDELGKLFESQPRRALEDVYISQEPLQLGRREANEEFPTELTRLALAWRIPGLTNPDTPALEILSEILGSGRSSILNREIRERKELAHSVSAGMLAMQNEGVFVIQAVADPDKREAVEKEALALVKEVQAKGISAGDLERARKSILSSQLNALTTARGVASDLGSNWLLTRNLNFSKQYLAAIGKVTADDVRRVAREYLRDDRLSATSINPPGTLAKTDKPSGESKAGEIKKFTLSNGLRLLVREDPRLPLIAITAVFRGGLLAESKETNGITSLFAKSILKGTKSRTGEQIASRIEDVGGNISSDNGNNSFSVSVDVMKPDLALGLDLLADVLIHPSFPEREVSLEKQGQLAGIKAEEEQPTSVARNLLRERLFGSHPYALRNAGSAEAVAALTPEMLREFHKEYAVAKNGVISVFGAVNVEEVRKLVEKDFASMEPGKLAFEKPPVPEAVSSVPPATANLDKQQGIVMVGFQSVTVDDPDRPAMEIVAEASNDLGSRFFNRIREKMGLAYFVGAAQFYGLAPGAFLFYLGTDPKKVEPVTHELRDEIALLAKDGLTQEELDRAKKKLLGAEMIRNQSNAALATTTAVDELMGQGFDSFTRRREEIEKISLDDTRRVASKYFQQPSGVEVTVVPPEKKP